MRINPPLVALSIGAFGIGVTEFAPMGMLPGIAADLGVSIPAAGLLVSAYAMGVLIGAPIMTLATARVARRYLLVGLMAIFTLGNLLSALATDYQTLMVARLVTSLNHGAFFGIGSIVAASVVAPDKRAGAVAAMFLGLTLATIGGVPLATWFGENFGWRTAFWGISGLGAFVMVALWWALPNTPAPKGASLGGAPQQDRQGGGQRPLHEHREGQQHGNQDHERRYQGAVHRTVRRLAAPDVAEGQADPEQHEHCSDEVGRGVGDIPQNRRDIGKHREHGAGPHHGQRQRCQYRPAAQYADFGHQAPPLQMRVMEAAKDAPNLASAMNIGAFNFGNAIGAALGGAVINAGLGYPAISLAGAIMAALGLLMVLGLGWRSRRAGSRICQEPAQA
jgi:DHA1 family inner membrane transport protein